MPHTTPNSKNSRPSFFKKSLLSSLIAAALLPNIAFASTLAGTYKELLSNYINLTEDSMGFGLKLASKQTSKMEKINAILDDQARGGSNNKGLFMTNPNMAISVQVDNYLKSNNCSFRCNLNNQTNEQMLASNAYIKDTKKIASNAAALLKASDLFENATDIKKYIKDTKNVKSIYNITKTLTDLAKKNQANKFVTLDETLDKLLSTSFFLSKNIELLNNKKISKKSFNNLYKITHSLTNGNNNITRYLDNTKKKVLAGHESQAADDLALLYITIEADINRRIMAKRSTLLNSEVSGKDYVKLLVQDKLISDFYKNKRYIQNGKINKTAFLLNIYSPDLNDCKWYSCRNLSLRTDIGLAGIIGSPKSNTFINNYVSVEQNNLITNKDIKNYYIRSKLKIKKIKHNTNEEYNKYALSSATTEEPVKFVQHTVINDDTYDYNEINEVNSKKLFNTLPFNDEIQTIDWLAQKNNPIEIHEENKNNNQEVVTNKVKKAVKSKDFHRNLDDIKKDLAALLVENIRLRDEYKVAKLDKEKAKWNDTYSRKFSDSELARRRAKLEKNATQMNNARRLSNINQYEPYRANGKTVRTYVQKNINQYKTDNANKLAAKKAAIEKSLRNTKNSIDNYELEYQNALKEVKRINEALKKVNFKPTKEKEAEIERLTALTEKKRAEAETARNHANIYIRKKLLEEKKLSYTEIEQYHYDGQPGTFDREKSGLDQLYAGVKPKLISKNELNTNYEEIMAILKQPIIEDPDKPKVVSGQFRGFFSSVGEGKNSTEFDYAELGEDASLSSNSKIITRFGQHEGMKNEDLETGNGNHLGNYQHVALGQWSSPNNEYSYINDSTGEIRTISATQGYWIFGETTKNLPKIGEASFLGEVRGHAVNRDEQIEMLNGEIGLKADFETKKIAGKMNVNYADSGRSFAKAKFSNANIGIGQDDDVPDYLADKDFTAFWGGDLTLTDGQQKRHADLVGAFYDDDASEAGGAWEINLNNDKGNASGVFRAKQTSSDDELIPDDTNEVFKNWGGFYSSARKEEKNNGDHIHISSEYEEIASHNPIENGQVKIKNQSGNDYHEPSVNYNGYQAVALGEWDYTHSDNGYSNGQVSKKIVYGEITSDIPKIGTAGYKGEILGDYMNTETSVLEKSSITGDVVLSANFQNRNLRGNMKMKHNGEHWANITLEETNIHSDGNYNMGLYGSGIDSGSVSGYFYGKNAKETAGAFNLEKGNEYISGVLRAKQADITDELDLIPDDQNEDTNDNQEVAGTDPFYIEPNPSVSGGDSQYTHHYNMETIDNSDYNYVKWGQWNDSGNNVYKVTFESGTTPSVNIPKIGHATYSGDVRGDYINNNTKTYNHGDITGNINFTANFSDKTVRGKLHTTRNSNGQTFADSTFYVRLNGSGFNGKITNKIKGNISGRFYGSEAQEAFGGFELNNSDKNERAIGNFRAKKQ